MDSKNKFIGSGIKFPIELNSFGRPDTHNDITLIHSSILNIINWPTRVRFFNEKFGCRIEECLEEPDDSISISLIKHFIAESLSIWEKRIELLPSDIKILNSTPSVINVQIRFFIRNTKIEETFIFPFYKEIIY